MTTLFANLPEGSPLHAAATELLRAAQQYWDACARAGGTSAVVWVEADDGQFVAMSRGEYGPQVKDAVIEILAKGTEP